MSKRKDHSRVLARRPSEDDGPPLVVIVFVAGGILFGYLGGQVAFAGHHPYHWAAALVGGLLAWIAGELVYRLRGDIV
ncbi:MAG TPA: hypothetical protein VJK02_07770 [Anaerolineales bacterium]|jgi:hypothetical protein|nr:hypothetical protein [Anaerolineales bacterium]